MKNFLSLLLLLGLLAGAAACLQAQTPDRGRIAAYEKMETQRQKLLDWGKNNPLSTYWSRNKRIRQARQVRQNQYTQLRDVMLWRLQNKQADLHALLMRVKEVPYVSFNALPTENLGVLAGNAALLKELLLAYPDNAAYVPTAQLLAFFEKNEDMEQYVDDYMSYLRVCARYPACAKEMRPYYKDLAVRQAADGNQRGLMNTLAAGSALYAQQQQDKHRAHLQAQRFTQNMKAWGVSLPVWNKVGKAALRVPLRP